MILNFRSEYGFLSNFALVDIEYKGKTYPSVEHAYMSAKSTDPVWKSYCENRNVSPSDVKKNSASIRLIDNWEKIKLLVMEVCLHAKFQQEPFRSKLIATGNENIQEGNYHDDKFWGIDLKVSPNLGENHLGRLLMKIREKIQIKRVDSSIYVNKRDESEGGIMSGIFA